MKFTALLHHLNEGSLLKAFYRLETKAAPGVDGVEWQQYRMNLEASRMEYRAFDPWELKRRNCAILVTTRDENPAGSWPAAASPVATKMTVIARRQRPAVRPGWAKEMACMEPA